MEQSESDAFRHAAMAAWSSALDFGVHPVVGYFTGCTVGVRVIIIIRFRSRVNDTVRVD